MASVETILWTAIPNGITGTATDAASISLSVHVAPNLTGGTTGTLTDFPDFQDWPSTFTGQNLGFDLIFTNAGGTQLIPTVQVTAPTAQLLPALWTELFDSPASAIEYSARDAKEPYTKLPIVTYPADQIASFLQTTYANLVNGSPTAYPSIGTLNKSYGEIQIAGVERSLALTNQYAALSAERLASPTGSQADIPYANDFTNNASVEKAFAALRFYHLAAQSTATGDAPPAPAVPTVDFHRALTFIGDHAFLQRALGLVWDLTIPLSTGSLSGLFTSTENSDVYLQVSPATVNGATFTPSSGVTYTPVNPRTQCDTLNTGTDSTSLFQAHASSPQLSNRLLTLADTTSFTIQTLDIDGGGLKNAMFADNVQLAQDPVGGDPSARNGPAPDAPTGAAPPSLRSGGISVMPIQRGLEFVAALERGASLLAGLPNNVPDLTAEDLVRGFVLDVYDAQDSAWRSTARRTITYASAGNNIPSSGQPQHDEPSIDTPPVNQTDPTNPSQPQLNIPPGLLRWTGWSSAAPLPAQALLDDGTVVPAGGDGRGAGPFEALTLTPAVTPGSLPRLRYGAQYALRARSVDIANNALPLTSAALPTLGDSNHRVTPLFTYDRFEAVSAPALYYNDPTPLPGESLKRLVIRDIDTSPTCPRTVAPLSVGQLFAELHGMFDAYSGPTNSPVITVNPAAYATIAGLDQGTYKDHAPITLTDPVPYMPDPLCFGAVLNVQAAAGPVAGPLAGQLLALPFDPASGQNWPAFRPFGLTLAAGTTQAAAIDETARVVTYTLSPADKVDLQLSSVLIPPSGATAPFNLQPLNLLGVWAWVEALLGGNVPSTLTTQAQEGQLWALTPWTTLELRYAVKQPLIAPLITVQCEERTVGETYAQLQLYLTYSPKSTSKTELIAEWIEPVDNGPGTGEPLGKGAKGFGRAVQTHVADMPSAGTQESTRADDIQLRHEFYDTKYRFVEYIARATTSFAEHYPGEQTITLTFGAAGTTASLYPAGAQNLGVEPGTITLTAGGTEYPEGTGWLSSNNGAFDNGTIEFAAGGPAVGSQATITFMPLTSQDTANPWPVKNIYSTARPATPQIPFVVPIFNWKPVSSTGKHLSSERSAAGLRVFIERPWWSSGDGELLGVLTWPAAEKGGVATVPNLYEPYVSDWGADPIFAGAALPSAHPRMKTFTTATTFSGTGGLSIEEHSDVYVNVAGHEVTYDPERDLWYADIIPDIGDAYTPMIRLALARYQPNSIPGQELSRVVQVDIMSLDPKRSAYVYRSGARTIDIAVYGPSFDVAAGNRDVAPGGATVAVEHRDSAIDDPDLGWEAFGNPVVMNRARIGDIGTWVARGVKTSGPHGRVPQARLVVTQFEVLPYDERKSSIYAGSGARIVYQDIIPL